MPLWGQAHDLVNDATHDLKMILFYLQLKYTGR